MIKINTILLSLCMIVCIISPISTAETTKISVNDPKIISKDHSNMVKVNAASKHKYKKKLRYKKKYLKPARWANDPKLDSIMKSGAKYRHKYGVSNAAKMQKVGAGDCWAMSEYLYKKFKAAGYQTRIIKYKTGYSKRHKSVQVKIGRNWETVPYRAYGYNCLFV